MSPEGFTGFDESAVSVAEPAARSEVGWDTDTSSESEWDRMIREERTTEDRHEFSNGHPELDQDQLEAISDLDYARKAVEDGGTKWQPTWSETLKQDENGHIINTVDGTDYTGHAEKGTQSNAVVNEDFSEAKALEAQDQLAKHNEFRDRLAQGEDFKMVMARNEKPDKDGNVFEDTVVWAVRGGKIISESFRRPIELKVKEDEEGQKEELNDLFSEPDKSISEQDYAAASAEVSLSIGVRDEIIKELQLDGYEVLDIAPADIDSIRLDEYSRDGQEVFEVTSESDERIVDLPAQMEATQDVFKGTVEFVSLSEQDYAAASAEVSLPIQEIENVQNAEVVAVETDTVEVASPASGVEVDAPHIALQPETSVPEADVVEDVAEFMPIAQAQDIVEKMQVARKESSVQEADTEIEIIDGAREDVEIAEAEVEVPQTQGTTAEVPSIVGQLIAHPSGVNGREVNVQPEAFQSEPIIALSVKSEIFKSEISPPEPIRETVPATETTVTDERAAETIPEPIYVQKESNVVVETAIKVFDGVVDFIGEKIFAPVMSVGEAEPMAVRAPESGQEIVQPEVSISKEESVAVPQAVSALETARSRWGSAGFISDSEVEDRSREREPVLLERDPESGISLYQAA